MGLEFRSAFKALFGGAKQPSVTTAWREIGTYRSIFSPYDGNLYANDVARACIRTLAEHTSKANARTLGDKRLETLLNVRPNMYMNGKDFLYKIRTLYEINNTVFVYINRDEAGRCVSLYPVPQCCAEAVDSGGMLFIRFNLPNGTKFVAAWDDLIVLRKDYNGSDIWGDANTAIATSLDLLSTTSQGMANAIKATANLRGILKSKIALKDVDLKRLKEGFVRDYLTLENSSGVAALDASYDYTPVDVKPILANYKNVEELRANIYRYYGVNEDAITNQLVGDKADSFYEGAVEPFLIALSLEMTYKLYTPRERGYDNGVTYESNRMQFMTMASKLALVQMVDRGALNANEWRQVLNLGPVPGGDAYRLWQNPKNQIAAKGADTDADQSGSGVPGDEPAAAGDGE